jgi:hypothetical protein
MKKILLMVAVLMMTAISMKAQTAGERSILTVNLKDGSKVQFELPVQQPVVKFGKSQMTVTYTQPSNNPDAGDEEKSLDFGRDQVESLVVGVEEVVNVSDVKGAEPNIRFDLTSQSRVHISGLSDGDRLAVVSLDGKQMKLPVSRNGSEATLDLSGLPRGCYIVSVNKRFSFKLLKP